MANPPIMTQLMELQFEHAMKLKTGKIKFRSPEDLYYRARISKLKAQQRTVQEWLAQ